MTQKYPGFTLDTFEVWSIPWGKANIPWSKYNLQNYIRNSWGDSDLHKYPQYLWPENNFFHVKISLSKYNSILKTRTETILKGPLSIDITKTELEGIRQLLNKNVIKIKDLVDSIDTND